MEKETESGKDRHSRLWTELIKKAKDDPELAEHLEVAQRVIERYRETLRRLAQC